MASLSACRKASIRSVLPHPDLNRLRLFLSHWAKLLLPPPLPAGAETHLRAAFGALIGIAVTGWICRDLLPAYPHALWLMAPLGASSVLIYVVPKSPFSHPWAVIVGNLISALSGMVMVFLLKDTALAAGLAVGLAIGSVVAAKWIPLEHSVKVLPLGILMGLAVLAMVFIKTFWLAVVMLMLVLV